MNNPASSGTSTPTVLPALNQFIRQRLPGCHRQVRKLIRWWLIESRKDLESCPAIPRNFGGVRCRLHPRFLTEPLDLEPEVQAVFRNHVHPGNTVLDVGAYVGVYTMLAAHLTGPEGKVHAFEPSPTNFRYLAYHCAKNAPTYAQAHHCLVSDSNDDAVPFTLLNDGDSTSNSMTFSQLAEGTIQSQTTTITMKSVTLDTFCEEHALRPDFIKIDVEGAEGHVLRGASRLLREIRPRLVLALHPAWLPPGTTPESLRQLLLEAGYEMTTLDGQPVTEFRLAEYLCLPRG